MFSLSIEMTAIMKFFCLRNAQLIYQFFMCSTTQKKTPHPVTLSLTNQRNPIIKILSTSNYIIHYPETQNERKPQIWHAHKNCESEQTTKDKCGDINLLHESHNTHKKGKTFICHYNVIFSAKSNNWVKERKSFLLDFRHTQTHTFFYCVQIQFSSESCVMYRQFLSLPLLFFA